MITQDEKKPPATPLPTPQPKQKPTREEEIEWFRKQAEIDLAARELFKPSEETDDD